MFEKVSLCHLDKIAEYGYPLSNTKKDDNLYRILY